MHPPARQGNRAAFLSSKPRFGIAAQPSRCVPSLIGTDDPAGTVFFRVDIFGGKYQSNDGTIEKIRSVALGKDRKLAETAVPSGHDFYYAAVFKEGSDNPQAFTAPVWMDDD